jgi:hypothetical protein
MRGAKNNDQDQQQNRQQAGGEDHNGPIRYPIEQPWKHQRRQHRTTAKAGQRYRDVVIDKTE